MSSTGGGIVVRPSGAQTPSASFSKSDAQVIADTLVAAGKTLLAAALQNVIDAC